MSVPSWPFLIFVLVGAVAFNIVPMRSRFSGPWHDAVWLVLNLLFVWSFATAVGPLLPFAGFLLLGYLGTAVARSDRRWTTPVAVILVLAVFIWLKRYSFIPPELLLPPGIMTVGLSYVFFRVMHLVVEAGENEASRIGVISYLNYTLNFPAFISGPIQRWEDYRDNGALPLRLPDVGWAAWRMVLGAFKVLILSAVLHTWQLDLLASQLPGDGLVGNSTANFWSMAPEGSGRLMADALIVVLYPLFLYANFSGYTDFVIGAARLYRLRLPENFNQPFAATNFIDFWSRWHISLSQWLRSHVFNPLLLAWMRRNQSARRKQYPSIVAFFVTFFLVGAWHGPTSEFLFFGLLQGGGVAGNRLYQVAMARRLKPAGHTALCLNPVYRAVARGLTFTWFAFTLLWFWASWAQIGALANHLGWSGSAFASLGTVAAASVILAVPDLCGALAGRIGAVLQSRYTRTAFASAMILALVVAGLVLQMSSPEIVYKQF